jgi:hypothetical protein
MTINDTNNAAIKRHAIRMGRYPSGQRGQTVNLLAKAFEGSNPPLPSLVISNWILLIKEWKKIKEKRE